MLPRFDAMWWVAAVLVVSGPVTAADPPRGYGAIVCNSVAADDQSCQPGSRVEITSQEPTKIIGGRQADRGSYSWVVAVARRTPNQLLTFCGGSIVAPRWVLTAAHCKVLPGDTVIVGRNELQNSQSGREIKVEQVVTQPLFNPRNMDKDAALLRLAEDAPGAAVILNTNQDIESNSNTELSVAGWGSTSYLGPPSSVLLEKSLYVISSSGCRSAYMRMGIMLSDAMFCADGRGGSKRALSDSEVANDVCQGDGGSGAVRWVPATNRYELVGIVSWGIGCGERAFPGVYTSVSAIASWANSQIHAQ